MTTENTPAGQPEAKPGEGQSAEALAAAQAQTPEAKAAAEALAAEQSKQAEKVAVPMEGEEGAAGKFQYDTTGNSGLDLALKYVGDQGFAPDHPAMKAAVEGNFDLLAAELAGKGAKGYEAYIILAKNAYASIKSETQAKQAKDKAAVEAIAGGAEQWKAASEWAAANADPEEAAELKALLSKGGASAKVAANFIVSNYVRASGGKETEGSGAKVSDVSGTPAASNATLSARDYSMEVNKARNAHKGREPFESSPAYRSLQDRRRAHRD